jgi:polyhydroxyalkanoate synthesis repressor PhaR
MPRVIKRYDNRKLYDTEAKHYVSLQDVAVLVRQGEEVVIIDNATGKDLTAPMLAKIIVEGEQNGKPLLPNELLHEFVRWGGKLMSAGVEQVQARLDRLLLASIQRVAPVEQIREEMNTLRQQLERLEALLLEREQNHGEGSAKRIAEAPESTAGGQAPLPGQTRAT